MKKLNEMTAVAAALAVLALGAACEEQTPPEEKVQEQVEQPAEDTDTATQPPTEEKAQ